MTCKKNIVLLVLAGIALPGLGGCQSQPYMPWQPGDSTGKTESQATTEAAVANTAIQAPESVPVAQPAPPPRVIMEPEIPMASRANAPGRTTGDVLLINSIQPDSAIETPRKGMSMASVRSQFGNPVSEGSSVGDPPITRWEYKGFSVYFEYDLVLHSVTHRPNRN